MTSFFMGEQSSYGFVTMNALQSVDSLTAEEGDREVILVEMGV